MGKNKNKKTNSSAGMSQSSHIDDMGSVGSNIPPSPEAPFQQTSHEVLSMFQMHIPYVQIPQQKWLSVINENAELKIKVAKYEEQLHMLTGENDRMKIDISAKVLEIGELLRENAELKERVKKLEELSDAQHKEISVLKDDNQSLKNASDAHQQVISVLKDDIQSFKNDRTAKCLLVSIQDINSFDLLEVNLPRYQDQLRRLRTERVTECHYLKEIDSDGLKEYKKRLLYTKLKQHFDNKDDILEEFYEISNTKEGFIMELLQHLSFENPSVRTAATVAEKKKADKWWK